MPTYNAVASFFDLVISVGIVLLLYTLLCKSLRELLDRVIRLPAGSTFYMRALVVVLLCGALTKVISGIHQKPGDHFMEYVWAVARDVSNIFDNMIVILLVYVAIVTILVERGKMGSGSVVTHPERKMASLPESAAEAAPR